MAPGLIYRSQPGPHLATRITRLVATLRFYLGGANYKSGRFKAAHAMLFSLEEELRALDLDGGRLFREETPFAAVVLLYDLVRASNRLEELAGGGNGGCAAAAQDAVARWLDDKENRMRMLIQVGSLASLCNRGKTLLDEARYSVAESAERRGKDPLFDDDDDDDDDDDIVAHGVVEGSGDGRTYLGKVLKRAKGKLRRLLRR